MRALLISLIDSFLWRVRGGWRIPYTNKKVFLNKLWFAVAFGIEAGILKGWNWNFVIITALATWVSYQAYGWGEYVSCACGVGTPNPNRRDCELVDNIVDSLVIKFKGKVYKLTDYPILFGWVGLSLRGLILSFIIGLALNSMPFMVCGLAMGTIYWLAGLIARKILKKYDKTGWNLGEICFGFYLGLCLCLFA